MRVRLRASLGTAAIATSLVLVAPAAAMNCSQPSTSGEKPTATDCLFILRTAVGSAVCEPVCVCAPKGTLPPSASDALICLKHAVGQEVVLACPCTTTTTAPTTTTTTLPAGNEVLLGVLPPTTGRFNYNLMLGVPGANAACNSNFPGTHACTIAELEAAEEAGDLVGVRDTVGGTVTSFWAIDPARPDDNQCTVNIAWDYATVHTGQFAERADLDNPSGTLGPVTDGVCSSQSWVGCCL